MSNKSSYESSKQAELENVKNGVYGEPEAAAITGDYDKAISIFVSRKDYFHAILCCICSLDIAEANSMIEKYQLKDNQKAVLLKICMAFENKSIDDFTDAIFTYDLDKKLTRWETSMLLEVKNDLGNFINETS